MNSRVEDAVKNARYNEAVIVTVSNEDDTEKREIVLVAALDKTNGGVSWQDAEAAPSTSRSPGSQDIGIQRHIRTKSWMYPMLNDNHRNFLYAKSIENACHSAVQNLRKSNEETLKVLDIGSGTGLLAMLAAKFVQQAGISSEVTSIEMASAMARLARKVIKSNGLDENIDLIEGHSCNKEFNPFAKNFKAMLCTSELLETGLLGEGIIPAMRDAWDRHLDEHAIVVPQRARVYAQVVEGRSLISDYCGPHQCDNTNNSFRLSTKSGGAGKNTNLLGGNEGEGVRVPIHAGALFEDADSCYFRSPSDDSAENSDRVTALSDPALVLEFDFTSKDAIPSPSGRTIEKDITALQSGVAHGVLFHWELDLWEGETYSTELGKAPWQDHWQQCLYIFADDHDNCERLTENETFTLISSHDDTSISFQISTKTVTDEQESKRQRLDAKESIETTVENHISHDRALQLNDRNRMRVLQSSIESAIELKGKQSVILDVSDFCLCAIIAAKACGAKKVTSLESSTNGIPYLSALVAQVGNQLPLEGCIFQVINAYAEHLTADHIGGEVDIVMSEPYYEILESWHLQEALNYYHLLRYLKQKGLVKHDAISLPTSASIIVCAVELDDNVARAHSGLRSSSLCGFNHEEVTLNASSPSSYDIKFPAFQYKWKKLSRSFPIAKIQYDGPVTSMKIGGDGEWSDSIKLDSGECHGIFIWIEYEYEIKGASNHDGSLDSNGTGTSTTNKSVISTGNRNHQQAFRFLDRAVSVGGDHVISIKPSFSKETLEDHDFEIYVGKMKNEA